MNSWSLGAFDVPVLAIGGLVAGGLAVGIAVLVGWAGSDSDAGPTAATLNDAFNQLLGAAVGLGSGAALVALVARRGPPLTTGVLGGVLGYVLVVTPVLVATAPSDLTLGESLEAAGLGAALLLPVVVLGATVGSRLAEHFEKELRDRS